jgi:DNA (cytosine-5)-methyltransferase 1
MKKRVRIVELFAGVGGFRIGLESSSPVFKTVWSNQWEPGKKNQFASNIYKKRFGEENHSNQDIAKVSALDIPTHDLLCGGFPCQDYSVARTLSQAKGIKGKKGVLWWEIHRILNESENKPPYLFLENVDRLLKSPAKQRGRDFAIILSSLSDLGYIVEWSVINAADYGMPQRRKRVFFLGYHKDSEIYKKIKEKSNPSTWATESGTLSNAFKIKKVDEKEINNFSLTGDLPDISENFNLNGKKSLFNKAGIMIDKKVWTFDTKPDYGGKRINLKEILIPESEVPEEFFINEDSLERWNYHKGAKNEVRINKSNGAEYKYCEGNMIFPDSIDKPSRTIVTGEGGSSPSRFKHVVKTESGRLRRLTPIELERLNMFPDNHTKEASDVQRAFLMGNALVIGVIQKIGKSLATEL